MTKMEKDLLELKLWDVMFISTKPRVVMKGYSRNKEDFRERLIQKYCKENTVYTVTKNKMKEDIYVEWESCSKCYVMKPHVQKRCEENWYEFQVVRFDDVSVKEFNVQAVPMLIFRWDWIVNEILNEEQIVNLISNK